MHSYLHNFFYSCKKWVLQRASPHDQRRKGKKKYIPEEQVRHVRYQWPLSAHLLKKYEYQYWQRRQYESEDEEYNIILGRV
jgi:hypothetical protein